MHLLGQVEQQETAEACLVAWKHHRATWGERRGQGQQTEEPGGRGQSTDGSAGIWSPGFNPRGGRPCRVLSREVVIITQLGLYLHDSGCHVESQLNRSQDW